MEEKSKGISLRKKRSVRPKISAPKQISGPLPTGLAATAQAQDERSKLATSNTKLDAPRERLQIQGGKTSDLVKRRYSTRYTQLPQDFVPPVPSVPAIPGQFAGRQSFQDGRPSASRDGERIKIDLDALRDPDLRPEQCRLGPCLCLFYNTDCIVRCCFDVGGCFRTRLTSIPERFAER